IPLNWTDRADRVLFYLPGLCALGIAGLVVFLFGGEINSGRAELLSLVLVASSLIGLGLLWLAQAASLIWYCVVRVEEGKVTVKEVRWLWRRIVLLGPT